MHIVILAYGPSQLTKRAKNRAHKLAGPSKTVAVVPASAAGRGDGMSASTTPIGMAGIRGILDDLPNEPVMIIHDDVVITTKGIMALQRSLDEGAAIAVPYSNDPNTDHFIGALPTDKAAERDLNHAAVPDTTKAGTLIRPMCVAGRKDDLHGLLAEPLVDPHATIQSAQYGFAIAAGAVAAHSSSCLHRLAVHDDERPLLVAALIVKDEEKMLPECLESLTPLCDRIEVCDTGSTDNTIAIAKAAGANVIEREWPNDFGKARNYVLDQCRDARYILVIDADERVSCPDPEQTRAYLSTYWREHPAFNVDVDNVTSEGNDMYGVLSVRLFHGSGSEYRGALHEAVYKVGDSTPLVGNHLDLLKVVHYGYSHEVVAERDKSHRNLELAEAQYEAAGDARAAVHLARSLSYAGESPERALQLLEQSLAETVDGSPTTRAQIMSLMADRCLELGQDQRAFDLAEQSLDLLPIDDTAAGLLATAAGRLENYEAFVAVAERITGAHSPREVIRVDHNRTVYRNHLAAAYARLNRAEEAVSETFGILEDTPAGFHMWEQLIKCLDAAYGAAAIEVLAPLAVKDPTGGFLEPLIRQYPTDATAAFCALYSSLGGTVAEAIRVGLLAAAMSGSEAAFATLAHTADRLESSVRAELTKRIAGHGRPDLAALLDQPAPAPV